MRQIATTGVYFSRAIGGDRDHRHSGGASAAGGPLGSGGRESDAMQE